MWCEFHVYNNSNLKTYFSFKKRYSMTNLGLVDFNKRFLSTNDARILKQSSIHTTILNRDVMLGKCVQLSDFRKILVTNGDTTFAQYARILKMYNENTRDK